MSVFNAPHQSYISHLNPGCQKLHHNSNDQLNKQHWKTSVCLLLNLPTLCQKNRQLCWGCRGYKKAKVGFAKSGSDCITVLCLVPPEPPGSRTDLKALTANTAPKMKTNTPSTPKRPPAMSLNEVEGQGRDVTQADQEVQYSLPQQHRGPAIRYSENPQSEHGTGVHH
ncbi:hypothetical protein INR49_024577 [Caranx melampygus]|nr:hypothetical protein INR49_024577 [Caranx melampygus]